MDITFEEYIAKRTEVGDEKKGPQYRALGDTCSDGGGLGSEGFQMDELSAECSVEEGRGGMDGEGGMI